jgi:hypothetical protein
MQTLSCAAYVGASGYRPPTRSAVPYRWVVHGETFSPLVKLVRGWRGSLQQTGCFSSDRSSSRNRNTATILFLLSFRGARPQHDTPQPPQRSPPCATWLGTKRGIPRFPVGRCGETLDSAPFRRLAELVSFGSKGMRDFVAPNCGCRRLGRSVRGAVDCDCPVLQADPKELSHPRRQVEGGKVSGHVEQLQTKERHDVADDPDR